MVVGPPGTGKTDTAVQVMHVLYHNCPGQRTLLITHSNQALNDLFQKILDRDVPARYLLRLGGQGGGGRRGGYWLVLDEVVMNLRIFYPQKCLGGLGSAACAGGGGGLFPGWAFYS